MVKKLLYLFLGILLLVTIFVSGCNTDKNTLQAQDGDAVQVHYTGTLKDGTVFDTSVGAQPLEFTLGRGQVIAGFEQAVLGMKIGQSRTVTIPAEEAYGPYLEDQVQVVDKVTLPGVQDSQVGQWLQITQSDGQTIVVKVLAVSEKTLTLDANHALAGQDLTFELELVSIQDHS